jgi:hypothetical protein
MDTLYSALLVAAAHPLCIFVDTAGLKPQTPSSNIGKLNKQQLGQSALPLIMANYRSSGSQTPLFLVQITVSKQQLQPVEASVTCAEGHTSHPAREIELSGRMKPISPAVSLLTLLVSSIA